MMYRSLGVIVWGSVTPQLVMLDSPLSLRSLVPSFELQAINRNTAIGPWTYKQRYSLAIFFFHDISCRACREMLLALSQQHSAYRTSDAEVVAIATCQDIATADRLREFVTDHALPFPILWDSLGQVSQTYLGAGAGRSPVGVFVCDRYGELYMQAIADEADQLPPEAEIRSWAEFVDLQCPECFPPSWR